jgi:sterol desaturase/sphingolipid hydroxylase (fatty acid hydroxylase superfamily)
LDLELKQRQFNSAMELYSGKPLYQWTGVVVSTINVSLQIYLLYQSTFFPIDTVWRLAAVVAALFLTDFANGLVHMFMDNNDRYDSIFGPFIANFHMHHRTPMYKRNPLLVVYFNETGSKIWLVGYLVVLSLLVGSLEMHPVVTHALIYFGILSSVAEVSHYLCHTSLSPIVMFLARIGLLLPKRHHAVHHMSDNRNYAFLNGFTDPLINWIAMKWCKGYKSRTDLHFAKYCGEGSDR